MLSKRPYRRWPLPSLWRAPCGTPCLRASSSAVPFAGRHPLGPAATPPTVNARTRVAIGVRIRLPAPPRSPDARQLLIYGLKNKRSGVDLRTENKYGHLPGSPGARPASRSSHSLSGPQGAAHAPDAEHLRGPLTPGAGGARLRPAEEAAEERSFGALARCGQNLRWVPRSAALAGGWAITCSLREWSRGRQRAPLQGWASSLRPTQTEARPVMKGDSDSSSDTVYQCRQLAGPSR